MGRLSREASNFQNPAFAALIIYHFLSEYFEAHPDHEGAPFPLAFIVVPMVFHEETRDIMTGTNPSSGLRLFVDKFAATKVGRSDVIATLHTRVDTHRKLTSASLKLLIGMGMVTIHVERGTIIPSKIRGLNSEIPDSVQGYIRAAKRLGRWTSNLSTFEIASTLKLVF